MRPQGYASEQRAIGPFARLGGLPAAQISQIQLPGLSGLPGLRPQPQPQPQPFLFETSAQQYDDSHFLRQQQEQQLLLQQQQMQQQQQHLSQHDSYNATAYGGSSPPGPVYGGEDRTSGFDGGASGFSRSVPVGRMQRLGLAAPVVTDSGAEYWAPDRMAVFSRQGAADYSGSFTGGAHLQDGADTTQQFRQQSTQQFQGPFLGQQQQQQQQYQLQQQQQVYAAEDFQGHAPIGIADALLQSQQLHRPLAPPQQAAAPFYSQQQQQQQHRQVEQQFARHGDAHRERGGPGMLSERHLPHPGSGGGPSATSNWRDRGGGGDGGGGDDRDRRRVDTSRLGPPALGGGRGGFRAGGEDRPSDAWAAGSARRGVDDSRGSGGRDWQPPADRDRRRDSDSGGGRDRPAPVPERRDRDADAGGAQRADARPPISRSSSQAASLDSGGSGRAPASRGGRVPPSLADLGRGTADRPLEDHRGPLAPAALAYEPEPAVGIPRLPLVDALRCSADLVVRYPRLFVPEDFTHAHAAWVHTLGGGRRARGGPMCVSLGPQASPASSLLPKHGLPPGVVAPAPLSDLPVIVVADSHWLARAEPAPPPSVRGTPVAEPGCLPVQYTVRVALLTDASAARGGQPDPADRQQHRLSQLKCLVVAPGGTRPMQLPGAAWSRDVDGGDPTVEDAGLVRTAVRAVAAQAGIDLSPCRRWAKVLELHYHRPAEDVDGVSLPEQVDVCVVLTCLDAAAAARTFSADASGLWVAAELPAASEVKLASSGGLAEHVAVVSEAIYSDAAEGGIASATGGGEAVDSGSVAIVEEAAPCPPDQLRSRLFSLRYEDLRSECRAAGLDAKGRKEVLIQRLLDAALTSTVPEDRRPDSGDGVDVPPSEGAAEPSAPALLASETVENVAAEVAIADDQAAVAGGSAVTDPSGPVVLVAEPPAAGNVVASPDSSGRVVRAATTPSAPPTRACLVAAAPSAPPTPAASSEAAAALRSPSPQPKLVSLRRLLQYNETDRSERLFELSLLAEAVAECLSRDATRVFAEALAGLLLRRQSDAPFPSQPAPGHGDSVDSGDAGARPEGGRKRPREKGDGSADALDADVGVESASKGSTSAADARPLTAAAGGPAEAHAAGCSSAVEGSEPLAVTPAGTAAAPIDGWLSPATSGGRTAAPAPRNAALREACAFLDRSGAGFFEARELEVLLGRAGLGLSRGAARRLVAQAALDPAFRARSRCRFADVIEAAEAVGV